MSKMLNFLEIFNVAEETMNFGTRMLSGGDSNNFYEAVTLAILKSSEENSSTVAPYCKSAIKNGELYISVENSVKVFENSFSEFKWSAEFAAIIDTFVFSKEGDYFLLCHRDGTLNLIETNEYKCIYTMSVEREMEKDSDDQFFIAAFYQDHYFLFITKTGQISKLELMSHKMEFIDNLNFKVELAALDRSCILLYGSKVVVFDLLDKNTLFCDKKGKWVKIFPMKNKFLILDENKNFSQICAKTGTVFPIMNVSKDYKDVILADYKELITVQEHEGGQLIEVLAIPDLTSVYFLRVDGDIMLIPPENIYDDLMYVAKISNSEWRICQIYETDCEMRLARLIKRRKYEEAEAFAKLFNLDTIEIEKAKVLEYTEKNVCTSEEIDVFLNLLQNINDHGFVLKALLDVNCGDNLDALSKVLNYGHILPVQEPFANLQLLLNRQLFRFETFKIIQKCGEIGSLNWDRFSQCDLIEEVVCCLQKGHIEQAKIIYDRLDDLAKMHLNEQKIEEILSIFSDAFSVTGEIFFPTLLKVSLSTKPASFSVFLKWVYNQVFSLEKNCAYAYPNNAITFVEKFFNWIRDANVNSIDFQRQYFLHRGNVLKLSTLFSSLKTLKMLKDEYSISIPLQGYLQGPQNVVRLLLSTEMSPKKFELVLKQFLLNFMAQHHLDIDSVIIEEIKVLMQYEERHWVNVLQSILSCLTSLTSRFNAVHTVLCLASIPWNDTLRKIAHDALSVFQSKEQISLIQRFVENEPLQVVLRRPKYEIEERKVKNLDDLKFFARRIIYCNEPTMISDVLTLCGQDLEFRQEATMLLIIHFIRNGCIENVLEILDQQEPKVAVYLCEHLAIMIEEAIVSDCRLMPPKFRDNLYQISAQIFKRLNQQDKHKLIRSAFLIFKNFNVKTTTGVLANSTSKSRLLSTIVADIVREFKAQKNVNVALDSCRKLATALVLPEEEVLLKFCDLSGNYDALLKIGSMLNDLEDSTAKHLCFMAVLLIKHLAVPLEENINASFDMSISAVNLDVLIVDDDSCKQGLQLANILVHKALCKAQREEIYPCLQVALWINAAFYSQKRQSSSPGFCTYVAIRNVFNTFCGFSNIMKNPTFDYLTRFVDSWYPESAFNQKLETIFGDLDFLSEKGEVMTSCNLTKNLLTCLLQTKDVDASTLQSVETYWKKSCLPKLISNMFSQREVNTTFVYNLLLCCDQKDALKTLLRNWSRYRRDHIKLEQIARIGLMFAEHYNHCHNIAKYEPDMKEVIVTVKWYRKFHKNKFHYDSFFQMKPRERFEFMVNSNWLTFDLVREYCVDYKLDRVDAQKYFLERLFLNYKPEYEIKNDKNGKVLIMKSNETELLEIGKEAVKLFKNEQVCNIINEVWDKINPYYYEVFIAMLSIQTDIGVQVDGWKKKMLCFLRSFRRVSKPSSTEVEQWYTMFPETHSLDPISEFRLCFTQFFHSNKLLEIMKPEINLKTYELWFKAIDILHPFLNKEQICSIAVKNLAESGFLNKNAADTEWILYSKHGDLFQEVDRCLMNIDNLEIRTSVMYHLVSHTSPGADQVTALELCYKYARAYKEQNQNSDSVAKAVNKVEKKYFMLCTMHILCKYQLTKDKKYADLSIQPQKLIDALYMDNAIYRKMWDLDGCPDINGAVDEIAKLYNLNVDKIRKTMIMNLLSMENTDQMTEDDILNIIAYICSSNSDWRNYLLNIGLSNDNIGFGYHRYSKVRALTVLSIICSEEELEALTKYSFETFMRVIDKTTLVANLRCLGINLTLETIDSHSKRNLMGMLLRRGDKLAIKSLVLMCIVYDFTDQKYWKIILEKIEELSLVPEQQIAKKFLNKKALNYCININNFG